MGVYYGMVTLRQVLARRADGKPVNVNVDASFASQVSKVVAAARKRTKP